MAKQKQGTKKQTNVHNNLDAQQYIKEHSEELQKALNDGQEKVLGKFYETYVSEFNHGNTDFCSNYIGAVERELGTELAGKLSHTFFPDDEY